MEKQCSIEGCKALKFHSEGLRTARQTITGAGADIRIAFARRLGNSSGREATEECVRRMYVGKTGRHQGGWLAVGAKILTTSKRNHCMAGTLQTKSVANMKLDHIVQTQSPVIRGTHLAILTVNSKATTCCGQPAANKV